MIKLESLLYFFYVTKYNSISRAADKLNITPSAISIAIKKLEDDLNLTLLKRTSKGVQLTTEGERIFDKVVDILFSVQQLTKTAQNLCNQSGDTKYDVNYLYFFSDQMLFIPMLDKISSRLYDYFPNLDFIICENKFKSILQTITTEPNSAALLFLSSDMINYLTDKHCDVVNLVLLQTFPLGILINSNTRLLSQEQLHQNSLSLKDVSSLKFIKPTWTSTFQYTCDLLLKELPEHIYNSISTTLAPNFSSFKSFLYNDIGYSFGIPAKNQTDSFFSKVSFIPLTTNTKVSLSFVHNVELPQIIKDILLDTILDCFQLYYTY